MMGNVYKTLANETQMLIFTLKSVSTRNRELNLALPHGWLGSATSAITYPGFALAEDWNVELGHTPAPQIF